MYNQIMVEFIIFALRYIPFWCTPVAIISLTFAYLYWLKDIRPICYAFSVILLFSVALLIFWIVVGGPDRAVNFFFEAVRSF